MLDFRLASILMAVFTSNIFIVILTLVFLNKSILYRFGLSILGIFCVLIFTRMALPFEFTGITKNIKLPTVISKFFVNIQYPIVPLFGQNYSIWDICVCIWILVFLVRFFVYIYSIKQTYDFIKSYGVDVTDDYVALINKLCAKKKLQKRISIINLQLIPSPSVFKYRFNYYILMPKNLELDEEEREFIFRHELSHVTHYDLTLKFLVQILCLFYWWNPCCYVLRRQSNLLFELRVDSSVVTNDHNKIARYLACVLKVKKYSANNKSDLKLSSTISFLPKRNSALHRRFTFLMENDASKNKYLGKFVLIPVFVLYLVSFIFIFEAYYRRPENNNRGTSLTSQNMYIVKEDDHTYDVYFNGIYAETVDSLENYPENCKIYLSLEEAKENEEN